MEEITIQLASMDGLIAIQDFLKNNSDWEEIHEREERGRGPVAMSFLTKKLRKKTKVTLMSALVTLAILLIDKGIDFILVSPGVEIRQEINNNTYNYYFNGEKVDSTTFKKRVRDLK